MAVVNLTFTGSEEEIVSGIPRTMTITSNIPSTIHFTVDGTVPTTNSPIFITAFEMPDGLNSVTLSAFGIDSDGYLGPILTQVFSPDSTRIDVTRNIGLEGFVVDRFIDSTNTIDGFDADGNPIRFIDKPIIDLDVIHSAEGRLGIADGAQVEILKPDPADTAFPFDDNFTTFSTNENAQFFNPFAKTIVIDNRLDNDIRIINRPWGSIRTPRRNDWGQREIGGVDSTYISGGFVKAFFSAKNNVMVSYYFDHNEGRYVKSIQELPSAPRVLGFGNFSQPLVFKWLDRGRHSTIPL
jgi:hypothetical protein